MRIKRFLCIFIIILLLFIMTGCNNNDTEVLKQKTDEEIEYLDATLISLLNKLNSISFDNYYVTTEKVKLNAESKESSGNDSNQDKSKGNGDSSKSEESSGNGKKDESEINVSNMKSQNILLGDRNSTDWENIKIEIENLYSSWNSIIIDLYKLGINNEDILKFSNNLDTALTNIKQENKVGSLLSCANLYALLPVFKSSYSDNKTNINIMWTKVHVINAYSSVGNNDWDNVSKEIGQADQAYSAVMGDMNFTNEKSYNVNKTYVTLKELQNSIVNNDEDIFYIKYKNFMQEVNLL